MIQVIEDLEYKTTYSTELNPKLFSNNKLNADVKSKIEEIVKKFLVYSDLDDIKIYDIRLVGSNASYNYNDNSDLDVHIVTDLSKIADPESIARLYMDATKKNFNDSYDISIHGIDVEIYVEDINSSANSNGIYSVSRDEWIKMPVPMRDATPSEIAEAKKIEQDIINMIESAKTKDDMEEVVDYIYLLRKDALSRGGETDPANLAFKSLRNKGIISDIKDKINDEVSKELSLESRNNLLEHNTSWISKDIDSMLDMCGYKVIGKNYTSIETTKGTTASRQATFHRDIDIGGGRIIKLKFDPKPENAIPKNGYNYVEFDPFDEQHKDLTKYVRVPATRYRADYSDNYEVYAKIGSKYSNIGTVHDENDLYDAIERIR